jgi:hypothetical protein
MADTVKISALTEITSGALDDNSVVPVVDGGTTYKLPITKLKAFVGDSFATDSELSNQISVVNSTINALNTSDISENASYLYYTDARVKTKLNAEGVLSGSSQVSIAYDDLTGIPDGIISSSAQVSASAAAAGFGGGGVSIPDGTISSSQQISDYGVFGELLGDNLISSSEQISDFNTFLENALTSSMTVLTASYAITAAYAENAGGGGGTDYISNVSYATSQLTFTGQGSAFDGVITLPFLPSLTYTADSASFQSRITNLAGGGTPAGTVSSSQQISDYGIFAELNGDNLVSSSAQIVVANADLTGLTADDIGQGITNQYYTDNKVLTYINSLQVLSGSAGGAVLNDGIVSSSDQIDALGFVTDTELSNYSQSVEETINAIDGVSNSQVNIFSAEQRFELGIKSSGSIEIQPGQGIFSGSGAGLTNIPASSIVGGVSTTQISDGDSFVSADADTGIVIQGVSGSISIAGTPVLTSGSHYSGSGAFLFDIPQSAIVGGVGGSATGDKIGSGSITASIDENGYFKVFDNTGGAVKSEFSGSVEVSGSIIADEISVGLTGTPTLFSSTNINLSASNAVVVTDSALRLTPQTDATIGTFTLSTGDIVYNSDDNDLYVRRGSSWVSLTFTGSDAPAVVDLGGTGIVSSSQGIADLAGGIVSSSEQIVGEFGLTSGLVPFFEISNLTGSSTFQYNNVTDELSVNAISTGDFTYTGTLSGPAGSTGSFSRLLGDSLKINNAIEFPIGDGLTNQVLKTDGAGNIDFVTVETLITSQDITTTGIITVGTGSVIGTGSISLEDNLSVAGTINGQTIGSSNTVIETANVRVQSGGQLLLSSSNADLGVVIDDVLVLPERETKPNTPRTGSIIVSASVSGPRPYFYDGTAWFPMFV